MSGIQQNLPYFYAKCVSTGKYMSCHRSQETSNFYLDYTTKPDRRVLDSIRFRRYCMLHENRDSDLADNIRIFYESPHIENQIFDNENAFSKMKIYFNAMTTHMLDVQTEYNNLLHIENHFYMHPECDHRYMIVLQEKLLASAEKHNLAAMTGMLGRRKHFFIPDQKSMAQFTLFYTGTIAMIFDFEEKRLIKDIR